MTNTQRAAIENVDAFQLEDGFTVVGYPRDQISYAIHESGVVLPIHALRRAAKDGGMSSPDGQVNIRTLRRFVMEHWSDCEDAIFEYLNGARE